jgi:hypothetical protein
MSEPITDRFVQQGKVMLIDISTLDVMSVAVNNNNEWFISLKEDTQRFSRDMKKGKTPDDALKHILDAYEGNISTTQNEEGS